VSAVPEGFRQFTVEGADGVPLAVFESRPPLVDGASEPPTLVLVNGLGGNLSTWEHVIGAFSGTHRIASWDYRGLYASRLSEADKARVRDGSLRLDVTAHAADAVAVLDALGVSRGVFVGWSMGVQLNLELWRHVAPRIAGFVQICGAPGRVLQTTVLGGLGKTVIPPAMELFRQAADRHAPWLGRVASSPLAFGLAKMAGLVAPTLDEGLAARIVRDYMHLDFEVYNRILSALEDYDATGFLGEVTCPSLIVAGTRDPMTPVPLARRMSELMPHSELEVLEGGSHYVPVELPEPLIAALRSFLSRRVPEAAA
jgi:pimeloyl-ACP methyl ester carboxylesterase